jgi:hypothetical protein
MIPFLLIAFCDLLQLISHAAIGPFEFLSSLDIINFKGVIT